MRLARINGRWIRVKDDYTSGVNRISSTPSTDTPEYTLGGVLTKWKLVDELDEYEPM